MRVCQVIASQGEGGLEKHVRELSRQLVEQGHEVVVFGDAGFLETLPATVGREPIRCDRSRRNPLLLFELLARLRRQRCDILHAQANKAASLVATLRPWLHRPTVGTLHNIKRDTRAFERLDHAIAVSRRLSQSLPASRVSVVYNGIAPPVPQRIELKTLLGLPCDRPLLCAVGRLVPAKGFDLLLDAIDGLPLSLVIAGEGPERQRLEQRIARLPAQTQCRLLGQREDVASLIASSDAVVISSRREGFSYVFNEALLLNARILSTDVPVANEVLPSELIVPVEDVGALRNRLASLLNDMDDWSALMDHPRQFAIEHMTIQAMVSGTLAVYEKVRPHE